MRAVIQRITKAAVRVNDNIISEIGGGLLVLAGVGQEDGIEDALYIAEKILNLRIFQDEQGKMNLSIVKNSGQILLVSQFTLLGDARKGRRPNFMDAACGEKAQRLLVALTVKLKESGLVVKEGIFGALMEVELINHGPVTILLDSKKTF